MLPPTKIYHYDATKPKKDPTVLYANELKGFDENKFVLNVKFYSNGATQIPIFILKKKNISGPRPCILFGYGKHSILFIL